MASRDAALQAADDLKMDTGAAVILGALIGGVTGLGGTIVAGLLQRGAMERAQRKTWRAEVYVALLSGLNRERLIIQRTFPVFGPLAEPPPSATYEVAEVVEAKLGAHSSAAMRALLERWISARARFVALVLDLTDAQREREAVSRDAELRGSRIERRLVVARRMTSGEN